jgi:hypothetical protein
MSAKHSEPYGTHIKKNKKMTGCAAPVKSKYNKYLKFLDSCLQDRW